MIWALGSQMQLASMLIVICVSFWPFASLDSGAMAI